MKHSESFYYNYLAKRQGKLSVPMVAPFVNGSEKQNSEWEREKNKRIEEGREQYILDVKNALKEFNNK